jgi:D-alanyl-D-alanine carboxypeptidase
MDGRRGLAWWWRYALRAVTVQRPVPILRAALAAVLLVALLGGTSAAQTPGELDPLLATKLQTRLDRWRVSHGAPGVAAAVRLPDGSRWMGTSGERVVGKGDKPVSVLTPFEIGSLTKTFVAALVLKLQEEGRLTLDQSISTWLPDYPVAKRITVRMLLSHRSGIYDYFSHPRYESRVFDRPRHRWSTSEILALTGPRYCRPNTCFHYSNTNYVLLGRIVKKVTGASVARNLRDRFLFPLGLRDTFFQGQEPILKVPAEGYLATRKGYQRFADGSRFRPNTSAATVANAAGAMVSSVRDISDWQDALLSGSILQPASLAQMLDFDRKSGYGLGMRYARLDGILGIGHGGSLRGFVALMYRLHRQDIDVVVLTNLGRTNIQGLADDLTRVSMRHFGIPRPPTLQP